MSPRNDPVCGGGGPGESLAWHTAPRRRKGPDHPWRRRVVGRAWRYSGSANTKRLLPELGRISGVRPMNLEALPVLTATYCRPSTA